MRSPVSIMYRWVLGAKDRAQRAAMRSLDKLHIGTPRGTEASTPGNSSGIPAGCVAWPVTPEAHDGAAFIAADCFLAYFDAKKKEVYCLDDIDGTRHTGALPLKLDFNVFVAGSKKRSGLGTVKRSAEYGTAGLRKNIFTHNRADLIAHHDAPDAPDNSSLVGDPDESSEKQGGLHYPLRVASWVKKFCSGASQAVRDKLWAPLLNMSRNGDGTDAHGGAYFTRGLAALSDEVKGGLACANDNNHRLGVTHEGKVIHQGAVNINALYGPIEGLYGPEEVIVTQWEAGSKGPFVMRVEKRPDFDAKHQNYCGKEVPLVIKWQTWAMLREYPPTIKEPPPTDDPPGPPVDDPPGTPTTGDPTPRGKPSKVITGDGKKRKVVVPAMSKPPEDGLPPTAATPNEIESPSRYGHPAPSIPDGDPARGSGEAPGDSLPEHPQDLFWDNRYGFREKAWNEHSNICAHEFALPVYESSTRGVGPNPWPVKNNYRVGKLQLDAQGNIIGRDANMGDGTTVDAPAWARPYHALLSHSHTWQHSSQHARIIMAGKNSAAVTVDGRTGLGTRIPTSPFVASGIETKLTYDGDGGITTPDAHITGKTEAAAEDALGLSKLVINPRLKTTAGRERKTTDTSGNLTLDATHHFVNITGAHTITLPATVVAGREYEIHNSSGGARTIARNGNPINGAASDFSLPDNARALVSTEADAGGWLIAQLGEAAPGTGSGDMLAANNLSDVASDDTAIGNLVGGGTNRTPTELYDIPIRDSVASNHGKASVASILTMDPTSIAFGGTPVVGQIPRWHKITIPYNQAGLGDQAAATANATLFVLPSGGIIHAVVLKNTTAWNNGGGGARIEASVGITGTLNKYAASWRWDTAVSNTNFQLSTVVGAEAIGATTDIKMQWDASAGPVNLNTGTVGSLDCYVLLSGLL